MASTSRFSWACVLEVLLAGPISSGVDVVPFPPEKDSYSLFLVDGVLIQ